MSNPQPQIALPNQVQMAQMQKHRNSEKLETIWVSAWTACASAGHAANECTIRADRCLTDFLSLPSRVEKKIQKDESKRST